MSRSLLSEEKILPEALKSISIFHKEIVDEVSLAVSTIKVVIVGMSGNPYVKKARKAFKAKGIDFTYLEYGSYCSKWHARLAVKLWSGWPTFPQVFVDGKLVGGYRETKRLLDAEQIK